MAGADALVLFNRFYQPDIDLDLLEVRPHLLLEHAAGAAPAAHLDWHPAWTSQADLAATGGIHTAHDVLKLLMAGANVTMMASALLTHGVDHLPNGRARSRGPGWRSMSTSRCGRCRAA